MFNKEELEILAYCVNYVREEDRMRFTIKTSISDLEKILEKVRKM